MSSRPTHRKAEETDHVNLYEDPSTTLKVTLYTPPQEGKNDCWLSY